MPGLISMCSMKSGAYILTLIALSIIGCSQSKADLDNPETIETPKVGKNPESPVGEQEPDLDDPEVLERILAGAITVKDLEPPKTQKDRLMFRRGERIAYTGWVKQMHDNGEKLP